MPSQPWVRIVVDISLIALGALLYTLASAPFEWACLGWIALAPLFIALRGKRCAQAASYGLLFGVMISAGVAYWMYSAISNYFIPSILLSIVLTLASYIAFVGVYTGAAALACSMLMKAESTMLRWTAIPAVWVVCEYARSSFLSGFSWSLLGYTQYRHLAIIQIADVTGIYGVSFLLACCSYAAAELAFVVRDRWCGRGREAVPWAAASCAAAAVVATLLYGDLRLRHYNSRPAQDSVRVALVERDRPPQDRWRRIYYVQALLDYAKSTLNGVAKGSVDLVVWPEFASGFYMDREPAMRLELSRLTAATEAPLLLGAPRLSESDGYTNYYNSAYLFGRGGALIDTYDKMRLLPFAEYRPPGMPSLTRRKSDYPEEFTAGTRSTIFSIPKGHFGVMICFEATYPVYARRLAQTGAQFIVNMSNDVWLSSVGGRAAAAQHFAMAVMRAVENKRALARATMAGITGFVDPVGRIHQLSIGPEGVTMGTVPLCNELTIYTRYGDWFVLACALYSMFCLVSVARAPVRE